MTRMIGIWTAALVTAGTASADPVAGIWQTQPGDDGAFAHVRMEPCGASICGTITQAFDADGTPVASDFDGTRIVWDMRPAGEGAYADGKIYAPDRDRTYNSKMELAGDRLTVSGCVLGICRGQTWARVD